jgi:purine-binding chemotaxis protein CheW
MPRQRHDPTKNLVGFLVGDVAYAVRIETVREIVNPSDVVELPRAPDSVKGVASLRGDVVPVVDLRTRFGLPLSRNTRRSKWIVVDVTRSGPAALAVQGPPSTNAGGRFVALVVDSVTEVFGTGGEPIRPAPPLGSGDDVRGIEGVAKYAHGLVFVLDVRAFGPLADAVAQRNEKESSPSFGAS